jgi:tetratricopeptide (TPR) repeat protein
LKGLSRMNEKSSCPVLRGRDGGNIILLLDGKTQITVQYAYEHCDEYQAILWARAESHEALTSSFVEIAGLLELPQKDEQDQTITVQAVKRWLQDYHGWLLILDNADEPKIVRDFLPTKFDGHILLTTRVQALGGLAQRIEVDTMEQDIGALLLLRRAGLVAHNASLDTAALADITVAKEITKELGGLPLALDQAGAYVEEMRCSLSDYQSLYRARRAEVFKERGGLMGDHPDSVATTWSLSFQRVAERNAAAADLLRLCAFLAPDAIPEEIITAGAEHLGPLLQTTARDPLALNKAIAALSAYSLIRRDPAEKTLSIHRLVQAVLRDAMSDNEAELWAERTVLAVSKECPDVEFAMWPQWERHLPHALVCADLVRQHHFHLEKIAQFLQQTGWYLAERARYGEAEPPLEQALTISEQTQGKEHLDTARDASTLGWLYDLEGKYEQAKPLYVRALQIREQQLGPDHPDTATSLNNLAALYRSQGQYEEAEQMLAHALSISEQQLGPDHPSTANSLNNLAGLYESQGKYEDAEQMLVRTLQIREQQLGPDHPQTALSLNNLAGLYYNQGQYEQAEPLYVRTLSICEQQLGPDHPYTATSLNGLAGLYYAQGKHEQAESLHHRALSIREKHLGHEHPNTAQSLHCLAYLYQHQKDYEQSEPLYQRALTIFEQSLGSQHPHTQLVRKNHADLLRAMGRDEEAEQLEEGQ